MKRIMFQLLSKHLVYIIVIYLYTMSCIRKDSYCNKNFTEEMSQADFFTHINIQDLISICKENKESIIKFRTIGIIESDNGEFYIKDLNSVGKADVPSVLVSMAYINRTHRNYIHPYTAQVFGTIQWKRRPIIYANMIQVQTTANALRLNDAIKTITRCHLASR